MKELTDIAEIKAAVDRGDDVRAGNDNYRVIKDSIGQYLIHFTGSPENWIGLHGMAGTKFADKLNMSPIYIKPRTFNVYVHLHGEYTADDDGEAFDLMLADIEHRHGMDIIRHEIIEKENNSGS